MAADGGHRFWRTIRFRITAIAAIVVAVVLVAAAVSLVIVQRRATLTGVERSLVREAAVLEEAYRAGGALPPVPDGRFARVIGPGGVEASVGDVAADIPVHALRGEATSFFDLTLEQSDDPGELEPYRIVPHEFEHSGQSLVLYVGASIEDATESVDLLAALLAIGVPALVALLGGLVWWLVGRTLAPIEAIRSKVEAMGGRQLSGRVPVPDTGDEVSRLAATMNRLLDRIEDFSTRQQRFVGDASHELRSPLTRIRAKLEVDLADPPPDASEEYESLLEETAGLERLVDDLLHLAKSDAAAHTAEVASVDVDDLVLREARRLQENGRVSVDTSRVEAVQAMANRAELGRAIRNVAENAERHARGMVILRLWDEDGKAVLEIADDGPGIPPDEQERIFERFARPDGARSAAAGGTGLGLSIAREIVERAGGSLRLADDRPGGATFVFELPGVPGGDGQSGS